MSVAMTKKLVLVSLDLMLALPILTAGFAFLFSSIGGSQSYLLTLAKSQDRYLGLLSSSQRIASVLDSQQMNYSSAERFASEAAAEEGISARMSSDANACGAPLTVCRLVTVSGNSYFMVLSYESSG